MLNADSNPESTTFLQGDCRGVTSFSDTSVTTQMETGLVVPTSWEYSVQRCVQTAWRLGRNSANGSCCGSNFESPLSFASANDYLLLEAFLDSSEWLGILSFLTFLNNIRGALSVCPEHIRLSFHSLIQLSQQPVREGPLWPLI